MNDHISAEWSEWIERKFLHGDPGDSIIPVADLW